MTTPSLSVALEALDRAQRATVDARLLAIPQSQTAAAYLFVAVSCIRYAEAALKFERDVVP